jgi:elongation factor Ts
MISAKDVAALRAETGLGMMDCKEALVEAKGDMDQAKILLRQKHSMKPPRQKATLEGHVGHYIHAGGKIAVLVEVNCETDFVAKNADFQDFVHNLAVHVAASNPRWLTRDEVPQEVIDQEREVAAANLAGKPPEIVEKIIQGRLDKFYKETCMLEQVYVRDNNLTITDLLKEVTAKTGERLVIRRFVRFEVGR